MRYLFVGDSAHAERKSSALLGKFDTFALPFFDDAAFELVKRTDERQHKFRDAGDVLPVLKAQTFFHKLERNTAMRQFFAQAEKIGKTSIEAVEPAADGCVAVLNFVEAFVGLRPAGVLIIRADAEVTEDMCHGCSIEVSTQRLVHKCTVRVDFNQ